MAFKRSGVRLPLAPPTFAAFAATVEKPPIRAAFLLFWLGSASSRRTGPHACREDRGRCADRYSRSRQRDLAAGKIFNPKEYFSGLLSWRRSGFADVAAVTGSSPAASPPRNTESQHGNRHPDVTGHACRPSAERLFALRLQGGSDNEQGRSADRRVSDGPVSADDTAVLGRSVSGLHLRQPDHSQRRHQSPLGGRYHARAESERRLERQSDGRRDGPAHGDLDPQYRQMRSGPPAFPERSTISGVRCAPCRSPARCST